MSESELDDLMGEVGGPCNVMGMVNMFQEKLAGDGNDPDELILQAFMAYDQAGKIDVKMFQHALTTWGDKMNKAEIDDIFNEFDVDEDFMVKTKEVVGLFVAGKEEEKKVEEAPKVEEAAAEDEDADAKKRRRRRSRKPPRLRRPLQRTRMLMPRRRRRRRRRLPSKFLQCDQSNLTRIKIGNYFFPRTLYLNLYEYF